MRLRSRASITAAMLLLGAVFCFSQAGTESLAFRGMNIKELSRRAEQLKAQLDKDRRNYETLRRLGTVRYYMAITDSKTHLKEALQYLEQAHQANSHDSQVLCYLGSAYIIAARDDSNPIARINYVNKGLVCMDAAVENSPDDIVARVIRGYTTMALPAFLNRRSTAYRDFEYLASLSEKQNQISPALKSEISGRLSEMYLQDGDAKKSAQYGAFASQPSKVK